MYFEVFDKSATDWLEEEGLAMDEAQLRARVAELEATLQRERVSQGTCVCVCGCFCRGGGVPCGA